MSEDVDEILEILNARLPAPTQRLRSIAQGLTFGFADEAEAGVRSALAGTQYSDELEAIRQGLEAYRADSPWASLGFEALGAALPAVASLGASTPASAASGASRVPGLVRAAGLGAAEGGLYAFGTGEGGAMERLERVPGGAALGGIASPVVAVAGRVAAGAATRLVDAARRRLGGRGSSVVEAELQRLARESGLTPDEIAQRVADGTIMAENETLRFAVRALRGEGGEAGAIIEGAMTSRPRQTREAAMAELQQYLSDVGDPNVLRGVRREDDAARAAERAAYAPLADVAAPQEVLGALQTALRRVPGAADEVTDALRAETGQTPFFRIDPQSGEVVFTRQPSLREVEVVRRAVANRATQEFRASRGTAGEAIANVERELRTAIDDATRGQPVDVGAIRSQAAGVRSARDAFAAGRGVLSRSADEVEIEFANISRDQGAVSAYRAGLMDALRRRMETGQRASTIRNLASEESREGRILRIVYPPEQIDGAIALLERAGRSQQASQDILRGSATAPTMQAAERAGSGLGVGDVAQAMTGGPLDWLSLMTRVIRQSAPQLTEAENARIARVLVSEDPAFVRRALQDESGLAMLQARIASLMDTGAAGARRGVMTLGAPAGETTGGAESGRLRGLLSAQ